MPRCVLSRIVESKIVYWMQARLCTAVLFFRCPGGAALKLCQPWNALQDNNVSSEVRSQ